MKVEYRYCTFSTGKHPETGTSVSELSTVKRIFDALGGDLKWMMVRYTDGKQWWYTERDGWKRIKAAATPTATPKTNGSWNLRGS